MRLSVREVFRTSRTAPYVSFMNDHTSEGTMSRDARNYRITVRARLTDDWSQAFAPLVVERTDGMETLLVGVLPDQSALHAVFRSIQRYGLDIIAVSSEDVP
ncbi:MAG TPA: hypothetical protein DIS79_01905 [Bacteroidetes bacterium]|nr:hypothetical protein [Bacteroidota bacterium]